MFSSAWKWVTGLLAGLLMACSGSEPEDGAGLRKALSQARAGETVRIGAGTFEGSFVVPAGVILVGEGAERSRIVAPDQGTALVLESQRGTTTTASDLGIEAKGDYGIRSTGDGTVELARVQVEASRGVAAGFEGLARLTLSDVSFTGPVHEDNAESFDFLEPTPTTTATHGLVLVGVEDAQLSDVRVSGFALFGALAIDTTMRWRGGGASANLNVGVMIAGGEADLDGLLVADTLQDAGLAPAYGTVLSGDAMVVTQDLALEDNRGFGMLQAGARSSHTTLSALQNGQSGVWVQGSDGLEIDRSVFDANGLAGVVAVDSQQIRISESEIVGTTEVTQLLDGDRVDFADGVQLLRATTDVVLQDLVLVDNRRVGMLMDLGGEAFAESIDIASVTVRAAGESHGAVAQNGTIPDSWDEGIERLGTGAVNDSGIGGLLDTVQIVGPSDLPAADAVRAGGLDAITGPSD